MRKERQVFPAAQARVKTLVAAGVVTELASCARRVAFNIATAYRCAPARGDNQRSKYPE